MKFIRIAKPKEKIRLDKYLYKAGLGISRSQIKKLIEEGKVFVNNRIAKPHTPVVIGDKIEVEFEKTEKLKLQPENIPLDIIYEDEDIIIINKPSGIVTHPAAGHKEHTLVNALLHHCKLSLATDKIRPGVLHRLDKDTSGLLVFAKTDFALTELAKQVSNHTLKRRYIAIVWGKMKIEEGKIDAPIGRYTLDRERMAVTILKSREAITYFKVVNKFNYATEIELKLLTGRTHQIRVHLQHIGYPIIGDETYGGRIRPYFVKEDDFINIMEIMKRQALHAAILGFTHPITKKYIEFNAPLPEDIQKLIEYIK